MHAMLSRRWVRLVLATALLVIAPLVGLVAGSEVATSTCHESGESGEVFACLGRGLTGAAIGLVLGALVGAGLVMAVVSRGRRVSSEERERVAGGPELGDGPHS